MLKGPEEGTGFQRRVLGRVVGLKKVLGDGFGFQKIDFGVVK